MTKSGGIFVFFDESRRAELLQEREEAGYQSFSDAFSVHDWEIKSLQVALISFSQSNIDFIALAKKGNRVVTAKSRIEFSNLVSLDSIPIQHIEKELKSTVRNHFIRSSQGSGSRVPTRTWQNVISIIKKLRPKQASEIDRLLSIKEISRFSLKGVAAEIFLQEREALGIALDIFDNSHQLRKEVLGGWSPNLEDVTDLSEKTLQGLIKSPPQGRASFLAGIPKRYFQEESAIQHDLINWEGMTAVHEAGYSKFQKGDRSLYVIYVNRNALEKTTGVDLIYFNEVFNSFVLVQYKLMKDRSEDGSFIYRPDGQLVKELQRMDEFVSLYYQKKEISCHEDYRLCDDGFMLKFIPNNGVQPATSELIKGMYVTREYMHFLMSNNGPKGKQGGKVINFNNSPRYLTNTEFSNFVNRGWIGTKGIQSEALKYLIKQYYESGNAVLVAEEVLQENANNAMQTEGNSASLHSRR